MIYFNKSIIYLTLIFLAIFFTSCSPKSELFIKSEKLPNYEQEKFSDYIKETKEWISKNRVFITNDKKLELEANTPFELKPKINLIRKKGILLVHGLSDSPSYFRDIANILSNQGFLVRVILLPGHGSKPADLILAKYEDWKNIVEHHAKLLKDEVDELWLGGFSTGANLVTSYALENSGIEGMLLFSPGFISNEEYLYLTPWITWIKPWLIQNEDTKNFMRYDSLSSNAAALYYKSMEEVQRLLKIKKFDKPILMTLTEHDSVLYSDQIAKYFTSNFTNSSSILIWYGNYFEHTDNRIFIKNSDIPSKRITNFSHLAVIFSPQHQFYGENSSFRMLRNGQEIPYENILDSELYFGAYHTVIEGKYHARLTWNPFFDELEELIKQITSRRMPEKDK